jgi:4'-phosphopantetheinyl transferase
MIHWLIQSTANHPDLARGVPPAGLLSPAEQARFAGLKTEKRRCDWLLGRWTSKRLVQAVIQEGTGNTVPFEALSIGNDTTGAPIINYQLPLTNYPSLNLSISHSHGRAFCAVATAALGAIGADMERIEPRAAGFVEDYFTAAEIERVRQAPAARRDALVTAVWSAKEAALKALGLGLRVDTRAITCLIEPTTEPNGWLPFAIHCHPQRLSRPAPLFTGWWRLVDDYVLTLVAPPGREGSKP